ncbi:amylo-alpha-1,6-glucosidase [Robinsoniella peoriensis]|uniref:alpha-L-rhamnosidase-related protein n=1 Tax=Robinsoniella peoriensis TaxID=180332 RepID=UPI00085C7C96|nr:amylo-alpha-1,6-glucosidase [Robinsoniella peoriensis]
MTDNYGKFNAQEGSNSQRARWIWYPGDFEIYHALKVNTRREERNIMWPAFWRLDDCCHNVRFRKKAVFEKETRICVYANGNGYFDVDGKKYPYGEMIQLPEGEHDFLAVVFHLEGLPALYAEGADAASDSSWEANMYSDEWVQAGFNELYFDKNRTPDIFPFSYKDIVPISKERLEEGILYDFGKEIFASVLIRSSGKEGVLNIYYGESRTEALDKEHCYLYEKTDHVQEEKVFRNRAFRYILVETSNEIEVSAKEEYLPLEPVKRFQCNDDLLNRIWEISEYTFHLNSREFFLDGIKRDRWIWSGDAYQAYKINQYLYQDKDISRRTILALRGKDPVECHINTITDYSFFWIMSVYEYYLGYEDKEFLKLIYPKMKSLMEFCIGRTDAEGFIVKKCNDWIFIDWADIDKEGVVCAEQILFAKSLEAILLSAEILGIEECGYRERLEKLCRDIDTHFWDENQGAYISSFSSGKKQVTRHANIFAVLYDFADVDKKNKIIKNVIHNEQIPQIVTPYFKFFELDMMGKIGECQYVLDQIRNYWGGMVEKGATTFWETYDPGEDEKERYAMYGDPYGKSLCHAWGASPIYLLGRYFRRGC